MLCKSRHGSSSLEAYTVACVLVTRLCPRLCDPMEFPRQEYWSGLPFPSPQDLLDPRIEPGSVTMQADSLPSEPPGK